ncbi:MAG TPA: tripartite tricarboxylate transporter TctB family protein [Gammaproteobacteria bacterium]|jgi:hypothetical protein
MSRRAQENLLAAVLLVFFLGYLAVATRFGPNARLVPIPMALIGLVCLVAQIVRQNLKGGLTKNTFGPLLLLTGGRQTPGTEDAAEAAGAPSGRDARRELQAFGFVALFVLLIVALGPVPAVFLFCAGFLTFSKHYAPWKAAAVALAFAATVYLLFVVGLELQLYHGLLEPWIAG